MPSLTRGPLPSSVYWRRRLVIITIAVLLVVGIAKLLGGGGGSGDDAATLSDQGSTTTSTPTRSTPSVDTSAPPSPYISPSVTFGPSAPPVAPSTSGSSGATGSASGTPTSALPSPVGDCSASDVAVTPSVTTAHAYDAVTIDLQLHTLKSTACTWHVSPDALQVRITRHGALVWSTVQCRGAIPTQDVVIRRDSVSVLPVVWLGHRVVADSCSAHAPWSTPGTFAIVASSVGGEPAQTTFPLLAPGESAPASVSPSSTPSGSASSSPSSSARTTTSVSPSGGTHSHGPAVR